MTGQEVAQRRAGPPATVLQVLQDTGTRQELARALKPSGIEVDYFLRVVQTVVRGSEALQKCTPASFLGAMMTSAELGLRIGLLGEAYLIPRSGEAMFQVGYQGWAKLARNAGGQIHCGIVYPEDAFDYELGSIPFISHKPALDAEHANKRVVAVWAQVDSPGGERHIAIMSAADVNAHRERYAGRDRSGKFNSPWRYDTEGGQWDQMALKTVIIKAVKYAPKSTEMERALQAEYAAEPAPDFIERQDESEPVAPPKPATKAKLAKLSDEMVRTGITDEGLREWLSRHERVVPDDWTQLAADDCRDLLAALAATSDAVQADDTPQEPQEARTGDDTPGAATHAAKRFAESQGFAVGNKED